MKKIYSHQNAAIVANARHILEAKGIAAVLKNEFASGAVGDISALDAWVELWVVDDKDYADACSHLSVVFLEQQPAAWHCKQCGEENAAAFEFCWSCQTDR